MTRKQFLATLACSRSVTAQTGRAGSVWAVHDGEKVEKDDLHNPHKTRNFAWDGRTIKLFAARNEVVAFQVIVEAGAGIRNLRVSLPELKQRDGRRRLAYAAPGDDPSNSVGRARQIPSPGAARLARTVAMKSSILSHRGFTRRVGREVDSKCG